MVMMLEVMINGYDISDDHNNYSIIQIEISKHNMLLIPWIL